MKSRSGGIFDCSVFLRLMQKGGYVYIIGSESKALYIRVTNNLERRIYEHKQKLLHGFSKNYNCTKLLYFEQSDNIVTAIEREKQLKRWRRNKKIFLIESINPLWKDLAEDWFEE